MNNSELSLEDIEFIKILAHSDSTLLQQEMSESTKHRLDSQIGVILRQYYKEHIMNTKIGWTERFSKTGILEDEGKAAIAYTRRLG